MMSSSVRDTLRRKGVCSRHTHTLGRFEREPSGATYVQVSGKCRWGRRGVGQAS